MPKEFHFALTDNEKAVLHDLARRVISERAQGHNIGSPGAAPTKLLGEQLGAFVTLKKEGRLRGCIGRIISDMPIWQTIFDMAQEAAFHDPRFPAVADHEVPQLNIEISVLSPLTPCPDPQLIEVGTHGLFITKAHSRGLLLPQVPVEQNWNREQFLDHTCIKAGLAPGSWKDPATQLFWFQAEVF